MVGSSEAAVAVLRFGSGYGCESACRRGSDGTATQAEGGGDQRNSDDVCLVRSGPAEGDSSADIVRRDFGKHVVAAYKWLCDYYK